MYFLFRMLWNKETWLSNFALEYTITEVQKVEKCMHSITILVQSPEFDLCEWHK
jgi:hypothetical protein